VQELPAAGKCNLVNGLSPGQESEHPKNSLAASMDFPVSMSRRTLR